MFQVFFTLMRMPLTIVSNGLNLVQNMLQELDGMLPLAQDGAGESHYPSYRPTPATEKRSTNKVPFIAASTAVGQSGEGHFRGALVKDSRTLFFQIQTPDSGPYSWSFGDGATSRQHSPSHTYADDGDYQVILKTASGTYETTLPITQHLPIGTGPPVVVGKKIALLAKKAGDSLKRMGSIPELNDKIVAPLLKATDKLNKLAADPIVSMPYRMGVHDAALVAETDTMLAAIVAEMAHNEDSRQKLWSCFHTQLVNFLLFMRFRVWDLESDSEALLLIDSIVHQIQDVKTRYSLDPVGWAHVHFRASPLHDDKPLLKNSFYKIRVLLR